jgi:hypothetical protein
MRRSSVGPLRWDFQLHYWKHFRFIAVIIPFTQPDHHISSFVRDCFSNGALDRVFPTDYNDLLSFQVEGSLVRPPLPTAIHHHDGKNF